MTGYFMMVSLKEVSYDFKEDDSFLDENERG